jgi:nucleoside-diphosphate-sugar epimerase
LAGSVGGLNFIGVGDFDSDILSNSIKINLHTLEAIKRTGGVGKIFFASSQCVYPDVLDVDPFANERLVSPEYLVHSPCRESDASFNTFAFGQEKLFAEKLYDAYARNHDFKIAIGRIGNTFGPYCEWREPRSKVVAALCRKVAMASYGAPIPLWGDGQQSRSFTYVDDTIDGMIRLMAADYDKPVNIAHAEPVTIQELFETICSIAGKVMAWKPTEGPTGVRARTSDNRLCLEVLGWEPTTSLRDGLKETYPWIAKQALTNIPIV